MRKRAKAKAGKAAITLVDAMNRFNPATVADPGERPRGPSSLLIFRPN